MQTPCRMYVDLLDSGQNRLYWRDCLVFSSGRWSLSHDLQPRLFFASSSVHTAYA